MLNKDLVLLLWGTSAKYKWRIKKQVRGTWKDITQEPQKTGLSVSFKFGEAVIGEQFSIEVYKETKNIFTQKNETHKMGDILVVPKSSREPKITKVVLFNRGSRDINKASYMDTLIAQAHCVGLFNQEIEFHLWEDDAKGAGHHAEINKHNKSPKTYKARVNAKGIAEVKISLAAEEKVLREIADRYMMKGDKNEATPERPVEGKINLRYVISKKDKNLLKAVSTITLLYEKELFERQRIEIATANL